MRIILITSLLLYTLNNTKINAQSADSDSAKLIKTLKELLSICKHVDFADQKTSSMGIFYKAATYIVYRGDDKARSWKDVANYKTELEKKGVDEICYRINNTVNHDTEYIIKKYFTKKESEGIWHVLEIAYKRKGKEHQALFAFLSIKGKFLLGDID